MNDLNRKQENLENKVHKSHVEVHTGINKKWIGYSVYRKHIFPKLPYESKWFLFKTEADNYLRKIRTDTDKPIEEIYNPEFWKYNRRRE